MLPKLGVPRPAASTLTSKHPKRSAGPLRNSSPGSRPLMRTTLRRSNQAPTLACVPCWIKLLASTFLLSVMVGGTYSISARLLSLRSDSLLSSILRLMFCFVLFRSLNGSRRASSRVEPFPELDLVGLLSRIEHKALRLEGSSMVGSTAA